MILIFGGTTEGRVAAEVCETAGKPFYYSTKGNQQAIQLHHGILLTGAMDVASARTFCRERQVRLLIDAAHPFANQLHATIQQIGLPVIRLQRSFPQYQDDIVYCTDYPDAIEKMQQTGVRKLLSLSGVQTIPPLQPFWQHHETFFRIMQRPESLERLQDSDFPTSHLIYYNKELHLPTVEEEKALMQRLGCDAILTKESGESGGYWAKVTAARELGLKIFVVMRPPLPQDWQYVTGRHTLRRAIESLLPDFFALHTGLTTGACATAATKAALLSLLQDDLPESASFALPDGEVLRLPVCVERPGYATVCKDLSDDPDVTKGCRISVSVTPNGTPDIRFLPGEGVGIVTLPGLGIPVGEPAINPTPREMMIRTIREITNEGFDVTVRVEHGRELALRTFNPRVGVVGGISIIGTSGIVLPLSNEAFIQSIERELQVAKAIGCRWIGLASGKKGEEALQAMYPDLRVIHYGNFVGQTLEKAQELGFEKVILGIGIGKAVKLAEGNLDTHSHKVTMNKDFLKQLAAELLQTDSHLPNSSCGRTAYLACLEEQIDRITLARELWDCMPQAFFACIRAHCLRHCRKVFKRGELDIRLYH